MDGKLIFVSGLSGAGKTTLMEHAIETVPGLTYLQTTTTRPPRPGEAEDHAYRFVNDKEYEDLRRQSALWDHSDFNGYKYGADVAGVRQQLEQGAKLISGVKPDAEGITKLLGLYGVVSAVIWIDTPPEIARARVAADSARASRQEDEQAKALCTHVFEPSGDLPVDGERFSELIRSIVSAPSTY